MLRGDDDAFGHDHGNVSSPLCSPRANGQISMTLITPDPLSLSLPPPRLGVTSLHGESQTTPGKTNDMMAVSRMPYLLGRGG